MECSSLSSEFKRRLTSSFMQYKMFIFLRMFGNQQVPHITCMSKQLRIEFSQFAKLPN